VTDTNANRDQAGGAKTNPDDDRPGERRAGPPDTTLANPLDPGTRSLVRRWLSLLAEAFDEDVAAGPTDAELSELAVAAGEWRQRNEDGVKHLRSTAQGIREDPLPLAVAVAVCNLLSVADDHRLSAARAALESAIAQRRRQA
jgi:hypothetical protein